jgi:hypothetical protein
MSFIGKTMQSFSREQKVLGKSPHSVTYLYLFMSRKVAVFGRKFPLGGVLRRLSMTSEKISKRLPSIGGEVNRTGEEALCLLSSCKKEGK